MNRSRRSSVRTTELLADTRGATMTEYVILVGVVGLVVAAGLVTRGKSNLTEYTSSRDLILLPAQ